MITLVGCGDAKRDEPDLARELYTSNYFQLKRRWAEEHSEKWYILSAEHGLVPPAMKLEPYDTGLEDVDVAVWADETAEALRNVVDGVRTLRHYGDEWVEITILAGSRYADPIADRADEWLRVDVSRPFDSTAGIGEQMGIMAEDLEEGSA